MMCGTIKSHNIRWIYIKMQVRNLSYKLIRKFDEVIHGPKG